MLNAFALTVFDCNILAILLCYMFRITTMFCLLDSKQKKEKMPRNSTYNTRCCWLLQLNSQNETNHWILFTIFFHYCIASPDNWTTLLYVFKNVCVCGCVLVYKIEFHFKIIHFQKHCFIYCMLLYGIVVLFFTKWSIFLFDFNKASLHIHTLSLSLSLSYHALCFSLSCVCNSSTATHHYEYEYQYLYQYQ